MKISAIASAALLAAGAMSSASAAQINGSIGFSGVGSTWAFIGACTSVADCDGFNLNPDVANIEVDTSSGDFDTAGSQVGDVGTMKDVDVDLLAIADQWTMGGFSFDLTSATVDFVMNGVVKVLNMSGSGTVFGAGFDPTPGVWSWTGTSTGTSFTFAPTTTAVPVSEPASLALVGLGLLAAGGLARRRRSA